MHDKDRFPATGLPAPALRAPQFGGLIDAFAHPQQGDIEAGMALGRGHETDGAVAVLFVIPVHESPDPLAGRQQIGN